VELGPAYLPGGVTAYVAPATRADGAPAVLKVVLPHREARYEAEALTAYGGDGAVRLLESDPGRQALLLERCEPGHALGDVVPASEALAVGAGLLHRLWRPPPDGHPFETLTEVAAEWVVVIEERFGRFGEPFEPALAQNAVELLHSLPLAATAEVLLHQDLHPANILAAEREPWLVIDPKPLVGDPAFDAAPLLLQTSGGGDSVAALDDRLGILAAALEVPAERIAGWALARAVETALWCLDVGESPDGALGDARRLAALAGT
jgi:streptomycin 6-kinase